MNRIKIRRVAACATALSLVASLCAGILVGDRASAQSTQANSRTADQSASAASATYPELSRYATDLTQQASSGLLQPVVGRDAEINRAIEILSRDSHSNPVVIGEAGPGVAEVAHGLAQRIADGDVPESLRDKRLFSLSIDALVDRAKDSNEITARLQAVLAEVDDAKVGA